MQWIQPSGCPLHSSLMLLHIGSEERFRQCIIVRREGTHGMEYHTMLRTLWHALKDQLT
jgi:hypothetical protein